MIEVHHGGAVVARCETVEEARSLIALLHTSPPSGDNPKLARLLWAARNAAAVLAGERVPALEAEARTLREAIAAFEG